MPIRPEDFDASPPPRATSDGSVADRERTLDKKARAKQEREISFSTGRTKDPRNPRTIPWAIAAVTVALLLLASEEPLAKLVTSLLTKPAPIVVIPPPSGLDNVEPPHDHVAETQLETPPPPIHESNVVVSPSHTVRETSPEDDASLALKRALERQKAELELKNKQLADAQTAIEAQRLEEAQAAARAREQAKQDLEKALRAKEEEEEEALRAKEKEKEVAAASHIQPAYRPSSGTLVWEGLVEGADLIDIQGGSSNQGSVSGTLPGVPVMVQAFPADAVTISVAPGPSNDWKRIVLRVRAKGLKKVTVRWTLP